MISLITQQKQISKILHIFDTSSFALSLNLASLKTEVDKFDIDKLKNVPTTQQFKK